jgi:WD40 repeat protein
MNSYSTTTTSTNSGAKKVAPLIMRDATMKELHHFNPHSTQVYAACIKDISSASTTNDDDDDNNQIKIISTDSQGYMVITNMNDIEKNKKLFPKSNQANIERVHAHPIIRCQLVNDESFLITVDSGGGIIVWAISSTLTVVRKTSIHHGIWGLNITHSEEQIICGCSKGRIELINFTTLENIDIDTITHQETIFGISRHPTQDRFALAAGDCQTSIIEIIENKLVKILSITAKEWLAGVAYISDTLICAGGAGKVGYVWDISLIRKSTTTNETNEENESAKPILTLDVSNIVCCMSISYDYSVLAIGMYGGKVALYTIPDFTEISIFTPHAGDVNVYFAPKSPYLVSGDSGGLVKIFMFGW